ncbi:MAG: hypothetical protein K8I82_11880, partial [Anaerolineae bacterium]|nr:hypothetical protein [Anaerolineae bacterium]
MIRSPEKLAWVTLLIAQLICLVTAGTGFITSYWFLFDSQVNLETEIQTGRGTVGVRMASGGNEEAVRLNRSLDSRESISVDPLSQGTIQFVDSSENDLVIANATIFGDSRLRLDYARRPRFHLGDGHYTIQLEQLEGRVEIQIPPNLPRAIDFEVSAGSGRVMIQESGFYTITATASSLTVLPRVGSALLELPDGKNERINTGLTGAARVETDSITQELLTAEIFDNPLFLNSLGSAPIPDGWGCEHGLNTDSASYHMTTFEGRRSVYVKREGQGLGPGATLCKQLLGLNGADVIPYSSLHIRSTLNVRAHSLSICGIKASECVLMLRLYYKNEYGQDMEWIHGFYSFNYTPGDGTPIQCDTCLTPHDQITPGNWYTYESPNLMNLPEGRRPTTITRIEFYASGHG